MKRGKRLERRTAMKPRTTWMPRRRKTPRRSGRVRDLRHLSAVHRLSCWLRHTDRRHRCQGGIEADHAGLRPAGRKGHDAEAIPLCSRAHRQRTDMAGIFRRWDKAKMRRWLDDGIAWTRTQIGAA